MDTPFPLHLLRPTAPPQPPDSPLTSPLHSFSTTATTSLIDTLAATTITLNVTPYDPALWLSRARTLQALGYSELALADAWKSGLLCANGLAKLDAAAAGRQRWSLGMGRGFWMRDEDGEDCAEIERPLFERLRDQGDGFARQLMPWDMARQERQGWYVPQPYSWLVEEHAKRGEGVVAEINAGLQAGEAQRPDGRGAWLDCRPCVFPTVGDSKALTEDALGLFATCDIPANTLILRDTSEIFGCTGRNGVIPSQHKMLPALCLSENHPNLPTDPASSNLIWLLCPQNGTLSDPSATLLLLRALLSSLSTHGSHTSPLSQAPLARLKTAYHALEPRPFTLADISTPFLYLQSQGLNLYTPPATTLFAPWVLFTLMARLDNNLWSAPSSVCLGTLFCMLNHSCEANARWSMDQEGCRSLGVWIKGAVMMAEEVTVEYDEFASGLGVWERRERFGRWIERGCGCGRCIRESGEKGIEERAGRRDEHEGDDEKFEWKGTVDTEAAAGVFW
ncbi:hypothetical protein LTR95_018023 [Oleoguttula sp. CCFEE 5521]